MISKSKSTALLAITSLVVVTLGLTACGGRASSGASQTSDAAKLKGPTIVEKNYQFNPSSATVRVGSVVTFVNNDRIPYHVTVGKDDLGEQQPGQSVTWTAATKGDYELHCTLYPLMRGDITVSTHKKK